MRLAAVRRRGIHALEDLKDLLFHEIAQRLAACALLPHRGDDLIAGGDAHVGGDERFLEGVQRFDVHGTRALCRGIGTADDFVEALDELFFGARQ